MACGYKLNVYTLFVFSSMLWAFIVFTSSIRDDVLPREQNINCDVIRVLNKTMETLNRQEQHLSNHKYAIDNDITAKPQTIYPSVIDVAFHNFTLKEKLRSRLKYVIKSHKRPADSAYNFNVTKSDRTPADRGIIDSRPPLCQRAKYDAGELPTASVVIPFYNEALSMLIRTVHSILGRSPDVLLQEVILVDDCSTYPYLEDSLVDYVSILPKVMVIRNEKREGLVRSRLIGAEISRGEVIIFLDAHTEANIGWLEPIVQYLSEMPQAVVQPFVDGIGQWDINYAAPREIFRGATSWDLRYVWTEMPEHQQERARLGHAYFSPTLIGCAIAVNKHYFNSIGGFDSQQLIWGGENIELSFRAWLCGGHVVTLPCSRVGHLFREIPYRAGDPTWIKNLHGNQMRVAEVWMDDYKRYFYASTTVYAARKFNLTTEQWSSLNERKGIRQTLKCKPFRWYLDNIVPDIPIPSHDAVYHGEIINLRTRACWEVIDDGYIKMNYYCFEHRIIVRNFFTLNKDGFLLYREKCIRFEFPGVALIAEACPPKTDIMKFGHWKMRYGGDAQYGQLQVERLVDGQVRKWCVHQVTSVTVHPGMQMPQVGSCDVTDVFQKWAFTYRFDSLQDALIS